MNSSRCTFSKFTDLDFKFYYLLAGDPKVIKQLVERPRDKEHAKQRFASMIDINRAFPNIGYYKVSTSQDGAFIGLGKIVMTDSHTCEIGYSLRPPFWGQGYGFELAQRLISHIKTIDSINKIKAIVDVDNIASRRILIKNGFNFSHKDVFKGVAVDIFFHETRTN